MGDLVAGIEAGDAFHEKQVVVRVAVAEVGADGELDGLWLKFAGGGAAPDAAAVSLAGAAGDGDGFFFGGCGVEIENGFGEFGGEGFVVLGIAFAAALGAALAQFGIGQAFFFGAIERGFFDESALAVVVLAPAVPFEDDAAEIGILTGAPGQGGIAAREEGQMIEI